MRGDDVELALHQNGVAAAGDLVTRQVEPEDHPSFHVCRRFGRIDVLALLVLPDGSRRESKRLAAPVAAQQARLLRVRKRALLGTQVVGKATAGRVVADLEAAGGLFLDLA